MGEKQVFVCLLLAVATNFRWTSAQPEQSSEQADTKGLFSFGSSSDQANDNQDDPGHTFSYEFLSPQKILTGCSGTKYANGDVKRVYYFVDATGKKKFIFPHKAVEVVFPSPAGLPGLTRSQKVHMSEMCFPTPCNVQGVCSPGSTIGPTGWSLPKFPWLPWGNGGKQSVYSFNLTSHGSAEAALTSNSANLAFGMSTNIGGHKKDPVTPGWTSTTTQPPSTTSGWTSGWTSSSTAQPSSSGWASVSSEAESAAQVSVGSGGTVSASAEAEAEAEISLGGVASASAEAEASAAASGGWGWSSTTPTTTTWGWKPPPTTTTTTTVPSPTPGWGWSTTVPSTTTGWGWSTTTTPTTSTGWGWSSTTTPTTTTTTSAPPCNTTTEEPTTEPPTEPPTTEPPTTTTGGWSSSSSTTTTPGPDCPGECNCCDKCPISKFVEKLASSGFGNNNPTPPMNHWASGTWNSYSVPHPNWPFARNDHKTPKEEDRKTPSFFANLPGAINGQVPVIYYPSCDVNAYYQPAIINYCSGWSKDDYKRSIPADELNESGKKAVDS